MVLPAIIVIGKAKMTKSPSKKKYICSLQWLYTPEVNLNGGRIDCDDLMANLWACYNYSIKVIPQLHRLQNNGYNVMIGGSNASFVIEANSKDQVKSILRSLRIDSDGVEIHD